MTQMPAKRPASQLTLPLAGTTAAHAAARALARRNTKVFGASAAAIGLLMLYPTSTNSSTNARRPGQAVAVAGVVQPTTTPTAAGSSGGSPAAPATTVVNGASIGTAFGPVQVQLAIRGGHIMRATAIDYPQGTGQDQEINSYAIPQLQSETLTAQSARIDVVSGATYTSEGYAQSLQSALDAAHIK